MTERKIESPIEWPKVREVLRRTGYSYNDKDYTALFGGYNDPLPNMRPAEPDDFWKQFSTYGIGMAQGFRQFRKDPARRMALTSIHYFIYGDGTGYAVEVAWKYPAKPTWVPTFYSFALCEHDRVATLDTSRGWHEGYCRKCGLQMNYDSGD